MPATDQEVFTYFRDDPYTTPETALLAYASYAQAKYEWMDHQTQRTGRVPTAAEADEWTASQPENRLVEIRDTALTFFADAAAALMQPQIDAAKVQAIDGSILAEVQRLNAELAAKVTAATSFAGTWKQGLFLGVAASFAFSALVVAGGFIFDRDPSPFAWFKPRPAVVAPAPGSRP